MQGQPEPPEAPLQDLSWLLRQERQMQCVLFILVIHSRGFASVLIKVAMMPPRKMPSIKDSSGSAQQLAARGSSTTAGWLHSIRCGTPILLALCCAPNPDLGCDCWRSASLCRDVQGDADAYDHSRPPPHHCVSGADFGEPPVK